ncbi:MAG: hypothetical protein LBI37_00415 [Puniceicoccales bacterium]|jgi:riboflavin kinase/FMN adenylyltransferase|nr:hypothetical protein [Puniceicoccales bacterium]
MLFLRTADKDIIPIDENIPMTLAIGVFDGVHLGHKRVIQSAIEAAKIINGKSIVYTFLPHPTEILGHRKNLILTYEQKTMQLSKLNVDYMVEQHFDRKFANLTPEGFIEVLKHKFKTINMICVGQNFRFGNGRIGGANYLESISSKIGVKVTVIQSLMANGARISSTRIRQELLEGNLSAANSMLGYNYYCQCFCEHTYQVSDILISTFSVKNEQQIHPGIYFVNILSANEVYHGIADYYNDNQIPRLDIYPIGGQTIIHANVGVEFLSFIRERRQFSTHQQRATQMKKDIEIAKNQKN